MPLVMDGDKQPSREKEKKRCQNHAFLFMFGIFSSHAAKKNWLDWSESVYKHLIQNWSG